MSLFPPPKAANWIDWLIQSTPAPEVRGSVLLADAFDSTMNSVGLCLEQLLETIKGEELMDNDIHSRTYTRLVLDEALVNCHKHGNRGDGDKTISVCLYKLLETNGRTGWGCLLRDQGKGFTVDQIPIVDEGETLYLDHGRGLLLMREFLDAVQYFEGGCALIMEKYRK